MDLLSLQVRLGVLLSCLWQMCGGVAIGQEPVAELIFPLHPQHNHAPGIAELQNGELIASWYRGSGERTADDVVADAGQIADAAAADEHDRVLLEVVPLAGDVDRNFLLVRESHTGDLAQRRVRLLRRHRADLQADAPLLRAAVEHRRLRELALRATAAADKLADRGHEE